MLEQLKSAKLKRVPAEAVQDRSSANVALAGEDVLADEAERWKYFFASGCDSWFDEIKAYTFRTSFVDLQRNEAEVIVNHWDARQKAIAAASSKKGSADATEVEQLYQDAVSALEGLRVRLEEAVKMECAASAVGLAFVKLSTRSPKDSKKALARAEEAYRRRLASSAEEIRQDDNARWRMLSEEVTRAGAVRSAEEGLDLLLDSERVFEDLEYALRGPKLDRGAVGSDAVYEYDMRLAIRAWDPRLTPQSEFRAIAWAGKLTCLGQYFHPLYFEELQQPELQKAIEADCQDMFHKEAVQRTVQLLGGHCIIDFAWLGPGKVIVVELNPFDGVCLGTFPASTGLFLWENEADRAVMQGVSPFEMRVRGHRLPAPVLKTQCNPAWRRIIYDETRP